MRHQSFYTKMIIFGCALSILPLLALGFFSYQKSSESIQHQVNLGSIEIMKQTKANIEQLLKRLDQNLNHVSNSALMGELLGRPMSYEQFQQYNDLRRELSLVQSVDTKVTDVILMNIAEKWITNNTGLFTLEEYPASKALLDMQTLPFNSNWVVHANGLLGSEETASYRCSYTITLVKKLPLLSSEVKGMVFASIPGCSLAAMMENDPDRREVLILDENRRIVVHRDPELIGKTLAEAGYLDENDAGRLTEPTGQFEASAKAGPSSVTYIHSEYNNWVYVSFTEISRVTEESRAIGWFTFWFCLAIICLSVVFVWFGSQRMYTPVRRLLGAVSDKLPELRLHQKNEFQLIHEHIQELFTSNTSLKSELHQNTRQIRTYFLQKWYQGSVRPGEAEAKLELYGYAPTLQAWDQLIVLTLQIDLLDQTRYEPQDLDLLLFAANNIVEELIPPDRRLTPVVADQTQVTLVGTAGLSQEEFRDYVYQTTESIQHHIRSYLDLAVSIGISLPFRSPSKVARAYQEGMDALKHRLKLGEGVIIHYANINSGKHTLMSPFPQQIETELLDAIKLADEAKAEELLRQWMQEVFQKERSPQDYQVFLVRLLNQLMVLMQESGISLGHIDPEDEGGSVYEELLQLYVHADIEKWFRSRIIRPLIGLFKDRSDSQYRSLSEEIIDLIHRHYDTDLTLEECAARLHYNASYLSSVFKKESGLSFSDYLFTYRFQMAKKWLEETDMPIKDMALKVGYNNAQNFIRSFRKLEGMTPGQYRSKQQGKDS